jgi:hypothetical protein
LIAGRSSIEKGGIVSEIARLREQIELECQAAKQGLEGLAVVANHDSINARMERLWDYRQELAQEVGDQEATKIMYEVYKRVIG